MLRGFSVLGTSLFVPIAAHVADMLCNAKEQEAPVVELLLLRWDGSVASRCHDVYLADAALGMERSASSTCVGAPVLEATLSARCFGLAW